MGSGKIKERTYYDEFDGETRKMSADDISIERRGKKIVVPEGMSLGEAGEWIKRKRKEDDMTVAIDEVIEGYPLDAAYAFSRAMAEIYGWTGMVPTPGFWGSENPPAMIGLQTGPKTENVVQVPWGRFVVPNIDGYLSTDLALRNGWPQFCITGEVKNKDKSACSRIAQKARDILSSSSIYRGKAIRIKFPEDLRKFNMRDCPTFIDTSNVKPSELIFSADLMNQVNANLFAPIEHTQKCRDMGVPRKRGVLLHGPFGTGKTLTANVVAKKCEENGWTFIYLHDTKDLDKAIRLAKEYQPCVVFAEDIDRVMEEKNANSESVGTREDQVQAILNTIDGVDTKDTEIIVVLTTNFIDRITQAMLRPGRLDAVISVEAPDAKAVEKLIRLFGRSLIAPDAALENVGQVLSGQIPAIIREAVERSKLAALALDGDCTRLTDEHLTITAKGMLSHFELLKGKPEDRRSDIEKAADKLVVGITTVASMQSKSNGSNGKADAVATTKPASLDQLSDRSQA